MSGWRFAIIVEALRKSDHPLTSGELTAMILGEPPHPHWTNVQDAISLAARRGYIERAPAGRRAYVYSVQP